ncbi:hypothetical protein [Streptomyces sp. NPDC003273]|uniref:hypothetical protein n=1 Tax=Streptomyces sp. NPDC003273 TaxID=3364678 RepID=UPI0036A5C963
MLHPARFVSEGGGGLLVHSSQLLVLQARDAGIRSEGPQVYVHSDVRSTDKVADVVDALRTHPLHRAQGGTIALVAEPCMEVVAGVDPSVHQQVGDGVGCRDPAGAVEVHGDGEVFRGEACLEAADRGGVRPR